MGVQYKNRMKINYRCPALKFEWLNMKMDLIYLINRRSRSEDSESSTSSCVSLFYMFYYLRKNLCLSTPK